MSTTATIHDLHRWQRLAYRALGDLLSMAERDGLAPCRWSVGPQLNLVGEPNAIDNEAKRSTYDAWITALSADVRSAVVDSAGIERLSAVADVLVGDMRVQVVLRATIVPADDEAGV